MKFTDIMAAPVESFRVRISDTSAAHQYEDEDDDEHTHAILFRREEVELEEVDEEFEAWLETAEEEEADDDLVLCGYHPIDEDTQVERIFYYRKSEGGAKVYSLDIDGTAVPGTLGEFAANFACFEKTE